MLPSLVQSYLEHVLPNAADTPQQLRLTQTGELRLKPNGRWADFTATQDFSTQRVAFIWRAFVRMIPLFPMQVVDRFDGGEGRGEVRLMRLPVTRTTGPDVTEASAQRYLAELPWMPHAMLANGALEWREIDARTVEVATGAVTGRAAVELRFDAEGAVESVRTDARARKEGDRYVRRPWEGVYSDYAEVGGVRIPTRAKVTWGLPDGPFTWFDAQISGLEVVPSEHT